MGPETLLAAIFVSFAFVVLAVGRAIRRTISLPELILIVISPIVFFFEIDAEIFLFLPFLAIRYAPEVWRWPAILILIIIATSIREIAVILYSPVLLLMLTRCGWRMRIGAAAFLGVFTLSLVAPLGEATLFLETTYWPAQGIGGLADKSLYQFVNLSFSDLMREYHLPVLTEYGVKWVIPWIGLGMFLIAYVARETRNGLFTLWFLALYISISILSIDHGRYAYFCFCFAVLASSPSVRACFLFDDAPLPLLGTVRKLADLMAQGLVDWGRYIRLVGLAMLALGPSGAFVFRLEPYPRIVAFTLQVLEKLPGA